MATINQSSFDLAVLEMNSVKKAKPKFSPKKHYLAWRLSRMKGNPRGNAVERMIRHYFEQKGRAVQVFGKNFTFDLLVNGKRVEIKSALATFAGNKLYYRFQHVGLDCFDTIVLVGIAPHGINVKIVSKKRLERDFFPRSFEEYKVLAISHEKFMSL
jgi:hypothetical protein